MGTPTGWVKILYATHYLGERVRKGRVDVIWVGWDYVAPVQCVRHPERRACGFCVVLIA